MRQRTDTIQAGRRTRVAACRVLLVFTISALAACSQLPRAGPGDRAVRHNASATVAGPPGNQPSIHYAVVELSQDVLAYVPEDDPGSLYATFGGGRGPAPAIRVGVGDVVQVTVFESQAGGLFIPAEAGVRPGNFVTFPEQSVDHRGNITVPYAGSVRASGRTPPEIEAEIVSRLADKAIEPQVTVSVVQQNATSATVVGEVNTPGRLPINQSGDRILDMIARAGGLRFPDYQSYVTLNRRGRTGKVFFQNLVGKPSENIYVYPGDTVYVSREQRRFMALGATGLIGEFDFERARLTLSEAVARAGGLLDERADPKQVLLYRIEPREALERMGADLSLFHPGQRSIPTVYRANFRAPDSFFLAKNFPMHDKDVIYVSNANVIEIAKFIGLIETVREPISRTIQDAGALHDVTHEP